MIIKKTTGYVLPEKQENLSLAEDVRQQIVDILDSDSSNMSQMDKELL